MGSAVVGIGGPCKQTRTAYTYVYTRLYGPPALSMSLYLPWLYTHQVHGIRPVYPKLTLALHSPWCSVGALLTLATLLALTLYSTYVGTLLTLALYAQPSRCAPPTANHPRPPTTSRRERRYLECRSRREAPVYSWSTLLYSTPEPSLCAQLPYRSLMDAKACSSATRRLSCGL